MSDSIPPLSGIRVLDIATFIAAPFCSTILGDFGAEVIKVEQPKHGDPLRKLGTATDCGDSLMWLSEARNKKAITLDLRKPAGAEVFKSLVAKSDVVVENFRPGTLEKWGLGYDQLSEVNPALVMLRISAYGQTGPSRHKPGFARIAHAFSGLSYLAGEPLGTPVVPGSTSLADYASGMWGAIGVLLALRARDRTGRGQVIDLGLYESIFRLLDEIAPAYAKSGYVRERQGADTVNVVPHSHYQAADGIWIAIACTNDKMFERLAAVMGKPELATDPEFSSMRERLKRRDEVNRIVTDWVANLPSSDVIALCEQGEVPCGQLYSIADIFSDAQYAARGNLMRVEDERAGAVVIPAAVPRLSDTPAIFKTLGRQLGADNDEVFRELLQFDEKALAELKNSGAI